MARSRMLFGARLRRVQHRAADASGERTIWRRAWPRSRAFSANGRMRWSVWMCEDMLDPSSRRRERQTHGQFRDARHFESAGNARREAAAAGASSAGHRMPPGERRENPQSVHGAHFGIVRYSVHDRERGVFAAGSVVWRLSGIRAAGGRTRGGHRGDGRGGGRDRRVFVGNFTRVSPAQGYGEAVLRAAAARTSERTGLSRFCLQSTEAGYNLYKTMGFRDSTRYVVYLTR